MTSQELDELRQETLKQEYTRVEPDQLSSISAEQLITIYFMRNLGEAQLARFIMNLRNNIGSQYRYSEGMVTRFTGLTGTADILSLENVGKIKEEQHGNANAEGAAGQGVASAQSQAGSVSKQESAELH